MTALKRLTAKYGIGEAFLDRLLREHRFVDLYAVVRGGLLASEKNYSIKSMEAFYRGKREGDVTTSGGSVVAYEDWRRTGDDAILEEIRAYNEVDCVSTEELRDWLVSIRPEAPWPSLTDVSAGEKEAEADERTAGPARATGCVGPARGSSATAVRPGAISLARGQARLLVDP